MQESCFYFNYYFLIRRDFPVISLGCSIPMSSIRVGAMSARQPPSLKRIGGICVYQDEGNRVGGMSGEGCAGLIVDELLCVTVVSADEELAVHLFDGVYCLAYAAVYDFDGLDGCLLHTGMAYHIRVCKVDDDHIVFLGT